MGGGVNRRSHHHQWGRPWRREVGRAMGGDGGRVWHTGRDGEFQKGSLGGEKEQGLYKRVGEFQEGGDEGEWEGVRRYWIWGSTGGL